MLGDVEEHIRQAQGRVEGPAHAAAVPDHGLRLGIDDRLEEWLELAAINAVGESPLQLRMVGRRLIVGRLHGKRDASFEALFECDLHRHC